jgi:hypothetical protein
MIKKGSMIILVGFFWALVLVVNFSWADFTGMLVRVEGDRLVLNAGIDKNMQPGTELYVYRSGQYLAKVRIEQVDEITSILSILSLEPGVLLRIGDVVKDAPPAAGGTQPEGVPALTPSQEAPKSLPKYKNEKEVSKAFARKVVEKTKIYFFKSTSSVKGPEVPIAEIANLVAGAQSFGSAGAYAQNPWLTAQVALDTIGSLRYRQQFGSKSRSRVELTYWDQDLTDCYTSYYAFKEVIPADQLEETRSRMYAEKGIDNFLVFYVKVNNSGNTVMQLAPFKYHVYLIDYQGNRVKAEKYDEILDKALNPNSQVEGYIYFPRFDSVGNPYTQGGVVRLSLEDIAGESTELVWK